MITGANSGLGLQTARALADSGATVLMAARSAGKYNEAEAKIRATNPQADLRFVHLDLADLGSVEQAARSVENQIDRLDVLVNNAGVMFAPETTTADGLELQIGTNHFGHFALTGRLLSLLRSDAARVVTVSSQAHLRGEIRFDDIHLRQPGAYSPLTAYSQSKLANLLFMLELQRRFDASEVGIRSVGAHPGYAATNLQSSGVGLDDRALWHRMASVVMGLTNRLLAAPVEEGALPQIYASVGDVPGGSYWGPTGRAEMRGPVGEASITEAARDSEAARMLWEVSVETTGVSYEQIAP